MTETERLHLFDVPQTISTRFKTVDFIFGVSVGDTPDMTKAKLRALDNFADHLSILIHDDPWLKKHVEIIRFSEE